MFNGAKEVFKIGGGIDCCKFKDGFAPKFIEGFVPKFIEGFVIP